MTNLFQPQKQWFKGNWAYHDRTLWAIYLVLSMISIIEVYSASSGLITATTSYISLLMSHVLMVVLGVVAAWSIGHYFPANQLKYWACLGAIVGIAALLGTAIWGIEINGARRWIRIAGITIQTSEFFKAAYIPAVAFVLCHVKKLDNKSSLRKGFLWFLTIVAIVAIVAIGVSNGSMALLYFITTMAMLWYTDSIKLKLSWQSRWTKIGVGIAAVATIIILYTSYSLWAQRNSGSSIYVEDKYETEIIAQEKAEAQERDSLSSSPLRTTTWANRIKNHLRDYPVNPEHLDINDKTSQEIHARLAIANCNNGIGLFPGNSKQRDYLSLAYSDFIFALIIEETGIGGVLIVLALYICLVHRCYKIAQQSTTPYHACTTIGIGTSFGLQVLTNISVAVGFIPITGQTLPIISHGGSSLLANGILFGILFSISRYNHKRMAYEQMQHAQTQRTKDHQRAKDTATTIIPAPPMEV